MHVWICHLEINYLKTKKTTTDGTIHTSVAAVNCLQGNPAEFIEMQEQQQENSAFLIIDLSPVRAT